MTGRRPFPLNDREMAERWRQMVLFQEAARLLDFRAQQAHSPVEAARLRRRAAQRRRWADHLASTFPQQERRHLLRDCPLRLTRRVEWSGRVSGAGQCLVFDRGESSQAALPTTAG